MNKQKHLLCILLTCASFLLSWLTALFFPAVINVWDLKITDQLFQLRYAIFGKLIGSPYVAHADLDDTSIAALPATLDNIVLFKQVITILAEAGVDTVAMDLLFPHCPDPQKCLDLTSATKKSANIYFPVIVRPKVMIAPNKQEPKQSQASNRIQQNLWPSTSLFAPNILQGDIVLTSYDALNAAAKGLGHISCVPDRDGIFRRFPLLFKINGKLIPALPLAVVCGYLKVTPDRIEITPGREILLQNVQYPDGRTKDISIPIDRQGNIMINYIGPWQDSFAHYSIAKLLKMAASEDLKELLIDELEGDIMVVSDISTGSRDIGPTPIDNFYPLSGLHANIISSILQEDMLQSLSVHEEALIMLILAIVMIISSIKMSGPGFTALSAFIAFFYGIFVIGLFIYGNAVTYSIKTFMALFFSFVTIAAYKYLLIAEEKAFIRARFENYFAPDLLKKILQAPNTLRSCEKKELTVLFSDIAEFTAWSSTKEATEIHMALNEYFDQMAQIVFQFGGTIDKYIGDGMLAFFGDPIEYPDHPIRAVRAAVEMQKTARILRDKWQKTGGMPLSIRIGINTGEVVVGNLGSHKRLEYTVIGAHVNLAQRLESSAPCGEILISNAVRQKINKAVAAKPFGQIKVKGFKDEFEVFQVIL